MNVAPPSAGLSLCAGAGGLDMGLALAEPGFRTVCYVEREPHAVAAIVAAQRAGYFEPAPVWSDLRTFVGDGWRGVADTILAGYPCFVAGTLILTVEGYRPIEDVAVGDLVLTHRGRWRRVSAVMSRDGVSVRRPSRAERGIDDAICHDPLA